MSTKKSLLAGAAALGLTAVANAAPIVSVSFQYVGAYVGTTGSHTSTVLAPAENGYGPTDPGYLTVPHSASYRYRFILKLSLGNPSGGTGGGGTATKLGPGWDFQSLGFGVQTTPVSGGATLIPKPYLSGPGPNKAYYVPSDVNATGMFGYNADGGSDTNDLMGILLAPPDWGTAQYYEPGENPADSEDQPLGWPTKFAQIEVVWNGQGMATMTSVQGIGTFMTLFNPSGQVVNANDAIFNSQTVVFGVPEPASLGLLSLGGLALARRRRD